VALSFLYPIDHYYPIKARIDDLYSYTTMVWIRKSIGVPTLMDPAMISFTGHASKFWHHSDLAVLFMKAKLLDTHCIVRGDAPKDPSLKLNNSIFPLALAILVLALLRRLIH
jgi:hypothetical protein